MEFIHGYPIVKEEGFTISKGAAAPEVYESYEAAKAALRAKKGSTLTYKAIVPPEEIEIIKSKRR